MEYVFGVDTLKTIDSRHSELEGLQEVERKFPGETVVDRFVVTEKINSAEDPAGNCYDWYAIREHTRYVDRTPPLRDALADQDAMAVDYEYRLTMMELGV